MSPRMDPERLPTEFDAAFPGRFASVRKRLTERGVPVRPPTDAEAHPARLLDAGVFIPDEK